MIIQKKNEPKKSEDKFNRDRADILTREERKQCKHGLEYKEVKNVMEKHEPSTEYSNGTKLWVRNYIILIIFIHSCHRAGVANLELNNFLMHLFERWR